MSQNTAVRQEESVLFIIFAAIALLFTVISGFQAYVGYSTLLGGVSAASFAIVMSLAMLFLNFALRQKRIQREETTGITILLIVIIFFMFLGDFTAIYKRFAGASGVMDNAVEKAWEGFQGNMSAAQAELANEPEVKAIKDKQDKFKVALTNFQEQCTDPRNPGMGEKARTHLQEIEGILGTSLTKLKAPTRKGNDGTANLDEFREFCEKVADIARRAYDNSTGGANEKAGAYQKLLSSIDEKLESYKESTNLFLKNTNKTNEAGNQLMTDMKIDSNEMKNKLEKLGFSAKSFNEINVDIGKFTEIGQAFSSAFYDREKPMTTAVVLFLTLLLNFLVPLITFVYYKPSSDRRSGGNSGGRGNGGGRGNDGLGDL